MGGVKCTEALGPLAGERLCVVLTDKAFPLVMAGGSDVADQRGPDEGLHVFLDPDHNGQLLPAGRKLQPLRNVAVIIFFSSSLKNKGHFQRASHYKTIAANRSTGGKCCFLLSSM